MSKVSTICSVHSLVALGKPLVAQLLRPSCWQLQFTISSVTVISSQLPETARHRECRKAVAHPLQSHSSHCALWGRRLLPPVLNCQFPSCSATDVCELTEIYESRITREACRAPYSTWSAQDLGGIGLGGIAVTPAVGHTLHHGYRSADLAKVWPPTVTFSDFSCNRLLLPTFMTNSLGGRGRLSTGLLAASSAC